jgi:hypothetical protein
VCKDAWIRKQKPSNGAQEYRDESGAESFRLFRGKTEMEWIYGNVNRILQNGNGYFFLRNGNGTAFSGRKEAEMKFPVPTIRNFCFRVVVAGPVHKAHEISQNIQSISLRNLRVVTT